MGNSWPRAWCGSGQRVIWLKLQKLSKWKQIDLVSSPPPTSLFFFTQPPSAVIVIRIQINRSSSSVVFCGDDNKRQFNYNYQTRSINVNINLYIYIYSDIQFFTPSSPLHPLSTFFIQILQVSETARCLIIVRTASRLVCV